jgi:single-strand DNA-binding protein
MNDIYITLTGNVAAEPRQYSFDDGTRVTSLKVFTSHRYFDKKTGQWTDGDKVCFTVRCWRALGDNVAHCVQAGQPVVVSGKLRIREFGVEGDRRFMPEIEASAVGHDLRWGTGIFTKPERGGGLGSMTREMRERLDEETQDWAMGSKNIRVLPRPEPTAEARDFTIQEDTVRVVRGTETDTFPDTESLTVTPASTGTRGDTTATGEPVRDALATGEPVHGALAKAEAMRGAMASDDPARGALATSEPARGGLATSEPDRGAGAKGNTTRGTGAKSNTMRVLGTKGNGRENAQPAEKDRVAAA